MFNGVRIPELPADTQRAALDVLGQDNLYLMIGDKLEHLFSRHQLAVLNTFPRKIVIHPSQLALVTVLQYYEDFADHQLSEAVGKRLDLKYALHLPLRYPGFDPDLLCDFRQWLLAKAGGLQALQEVLDSLPGYGLFGSAVDEPVDAYGLLLHVCTLSRLEKLVDTMFMMLEILAYSQPDWLRGIVLPHWYQRYIQSGFAGRLPYSLEERQALALAVGQDMDYLLRKVNQARAHGFVEPHEFIALKQLVNDQYDNSPGGVCWRSQCRISTCHWEGFPDEMRRGSGNGKQSHSQEHVAVAAE